MWARAKQAHIEKKTQQRSPQGFWPYGPDPTHGLSSSTWKIYYFLKYITICGTDPTNWDRPTTYIHKHLTRSIITQVQFFRQKLQTFIQFLYGPKLQILHSAFFCGPKLQTLHGAIFLAKIANLPMTHNYPSPLYTQETYWVVVTTPKPTLYFYSIFLLLSSSYYLMWDFGEYPLENQHILPSPKVSHALEQKFDTLSTNLLELLLLLVIFTDSLTMTIFLINGPHRLAHQTRCRQLPHLCH